MVAGSTGPSLANFQSFITNVMQIPTSALPSDSPWIEGSYDYAMAQVNPAFAAASPLIYNAAVNNLAGSLLINYAPDQTGQTYFADLRKEWNLTGFVPGVVLNTADVTTSAGLVVPQVFQNITIGDLQKLKDPYGRAYLAFAEDYGPAGWGLS